MEVAHPPSLTQPSRLREHLPSRGDHGPYRRLRMQQNRSGREDRSNLPTRERREKRCVPRRAIPTSQYEHEIQSSFYVSCAGGNIGYEPRCRSAEGGGKGGPDAIDLQ